MEILGGCTEEVSDFPDPLEQPKYLSLRRSSSCLTPCRALSRGGYLARWCFSLRCCPPLPQISAAAKWGSTSSAAGVIAVALEEL